MYYIYISTYYRRDTINFHNSTRTIPPLRLMIPARNFVSQSRERTERKGGGDVAIPLDGKKTKTKKEKETKTN